MNTANRSGPGTRRATPAVTANRPLGLAWPLVIALAIAAVYVSSLSGELVADDWAMIHDNAEQMRGFGAIERFFTAGVWESSNIQQSDSALYRPVWLLWDFALYNLFGEDPFWWRVSNLALHIATAVLVASLLSAMLPALSGLERAAGALVFALHPAKVQSVAWISGSTDPLMTCLFVGAVLLYLRYRRTGNALALGGTLVCYAAAMLTKEPAIVLPAVLLAIDLWFFSAARLRERFWSLLAIYGLFAAVAIGYLALRHFALGGALQGKNLFTIDADALFRLVDYGLGYLRQLVVPWPVPFYHQHIEGGIADALTFVVGSIVLACLLVALLRGRVARIGAIWLGAGVAAPLALALHEAGVFAPRFLYLPSVGALLVAAAGYLWLRQRMSVATIAILPAIAAVFAGLTVLELPNWRNDLAWTAHTLANDPGARHGWGRRAEHFRRTGDKEGMAETWRQAADAVDSDADRTKFLEQLAIFEAERGRLDQSMAAFERITGLSGSEAAGFIGIGNIHWMMRRTDAALEAYDAALLHEPDNPLALANRARLSEAVGDAEAALAHYRRLLALPETSAFRDVRTHAARFVRRHGGS